MELAIMQPYWWPYIGYFQLLAAVDEFVVYDNIQFTKKGWIHRNRLLQNGSDALFTLPLASASDYLDVRERTISDTFKPNALLQRFASAYGRAPFYRQTLPLLEEVLGSPERNLFDFVLHSIRATAAHLGIDTPITVSSTVEIDHDLKAAAKVKALCQARGATTYLNPIGGLDLYDRADFAAAGIDLRFHRALPHPYPQKAPEFVPWLSIVDVLVSNSPEDVHTMVHSGFEVL